MKYMTPEQVQDEKFEKELVESGILCKNCREVVESSIIGTSRMLKPHGIPCLCDKCKTAKPMETTYEGFITRRFMKRR